MPGGNGLHMRHASAVGLWASRRDAVAICGFLSGKITAWLLKRYILQPFETCCFFHNKGKKHHLQVAMFRCIIYSAGRLSLFFGLVPRVPSVRCFENDRSRGNGSPRFKLFSGTMWVWVTVKPLDSRLSPFHLGFHCGYPFLTIWFCGGFPLIQNMFFLGFKGDLSLLDT